MCVYVCASAYVCASVYVCVCVCVCVCMCVCVRAVNEIIIENIHIYLCD